MSATTADIPLTANGASAAPLEDHKIDPSIGQAISHGNVGASEASAAPAYAADAPNGVPSSGPTVAAPEKAGSLGSGAGEATTTTTTTIITTTTGPPASGSTVASPVAADGTSLASPNPAFTSTAPTSPVVGGEAAGATAGPGSALLARDGATNDSAVSPTSPTTAPTTTDTAAPTSNGVVPAAAAGAAGGAGAAALAKKEEEKKAAVPVMSPKDAKKYTKLLKKESKNEEKELAAALKAAHSDEKAMRKARKAESQSIKRHQSAVSDEHKTSKALNKAKLVQEKAAAALQKATEELDIKKRHTTATSESYEKIKAKIDTLRNDKIANDKDRARRQASISHAG